VFKVVQGYCFSGQSKAGVRLLISLVSNNNLAPFLRSGSGSGFSRQAPELGHHTDGDLLAKSRNFYIFSFSAIAWGDFFRIYKKSFTDFKNEFSM